MEMETSTRRMHERTQSYHSRRLGEALGRTDQLLSQLCNVAATHLLEFALQFPMSARLLATKSIDQHEHKMLLVSPNAGQAIERTRTLLASASEISYCAPKAIHSAEVLQGVALGMRSVHHELLASSDELNSLLCNYLHDDD